MAAARGGRAAFALTDAGRDEARLRGMLCAFALMTWALRVATAALGLVLRVFGHKEG